MRRKLEVTYDDMMQLREQGYSNKDIAYMLDVSKATVQRYIGKQGRHIKSICDTPTLYYEHGTGCKKEQAQVQLLSQTVAVNGYWFELNMCNKTAKVTVPSDEYCSGRILLRVDEVDKFIHALESVKNMLEETTDE